MSGKNKEKSEKVIKETVAEYTVVERAVEPKGAQKPQKSSASVASAESVLLHELEPWQRSLDSYSDEELDELYADYAEEARQLAEVGIEEYAQHLRELDKA